MTDAPRAGVLWLVLVPALLFAAHARADWVHESAEIMGTAIEVELWHDDIARAREAAAVLAEMHRVDAAMSPYREDSELSAVNRDAAARPVPVSAELFALLQRSIEFSELTGGAFDITFASVGFLYDFRAGVAPDAEAIERALPAVNYRDLELDPEHRRVRFGSPGMRIDLGGIAKGHAVDRSIEILRTLGVRHASVSAGGDTRVLGDHRGRPWMIGIRDPRRRGATIAVLPLVDEAVSTSGDYERYFIRDGVRYHHILDPDTGLPASGVRSVTVIGPEATTTDALSTSVFVLGVEKGLALIESLPEVEAVISDRDGRLFYSSGLAPPVTGADAATH